MAEYAVFLYAPNEGDDGEGTGDELAAHDRYSQSMQRDGVMLCAFALESVESATSIRAEGITDGPFIESKEVILGFYVIEADDLDGALRIARDNPIIVQGGGVEVRPVHAGVIPDRGDSAH